MQAYTYVSKGKFELREKPKPTLMQERDAIVKVTHWSRRRNKRKYTKKL